MTLVADLFDKLQTSSAFKVVVKIADEPIYKWWDWKP